MRSVRRIVGGQAGLRIQPAGQERSSKQSSDTPNHPIGIRSRWAVVAMMVGLLVIAAGGGTTALWWLSQRSSSNPSTAPPVGAEQSDTASDNETSAATEVPSPAPVTQVVRQAPVERRRSSRIQPLISSAYTDGIDEYAIRSTLKCRSPTGGSTMKIPSRSMRGPLRTVTT